jgi:prevent-host-death family protein
MKTVTATNVKSNLGEYMDAASREPVAITRQGRAHAVLVGWEEYQRLLAVEDAWWAERARQAEAGGMLGADESLAFLKAKLRA